MAVSDVYDFYRKMEDEKIVLSFKGEFTEDLLTSVFKILESKMLELEINPKKKKRVFNVLIECFQNLYHHISTINVDDKTIHLKKSALILIKYVGEKFVIKTGNYILNESIDDLKKRLLMVNALDTDELRDLYQKKLKNDPRTKKGTAGLGLIDIARKAKSKLEYEFLDIEDSSSFFCLNVVIE